MKQLNIFIGYDAREPDAFKVAAHTLKRHSNINANILPIDRFISHGLITRVVDRRGAPYDLISGASFSTDFAITRFLVPIICPGGWALFVDSDVVFLDDVTKILEHADPGKAVMVVKHTYTPSEAIKKRGLEQLRYSRKNWSSVMLFNCDHPANQRLTLADVNHRPGRDLHQFYWLHDDEIGELPADFNWLVNVTPKPDTPKIAHFTLGGPWLDGWQPAPFDKIWSDAYDCLKHRIG